MGWTWRPDLLTTSMRDRVRFRIGDIDQSRPVFRDEELDYMLLAAGATATVNDGVVLMAAVSAVRAWMQRVQVSRDASAGAGGPLELYARVATLKQLLGDLEAERARRRTHAPYAGGTSIDDRDTRDSDNDRVPFAFPDAGEAARDNWDTTQDPDDD